MTGQGLLRIAGVHTFYGQIEALRGVSMDVGQGEIVTLIGANGAGKTTLFRMLTGQEQPDGGTIRAGSGCTAGGVAIIAPFKPASTISTSAMKRYPRVGTVSM